ncbi:ankyrin repeat-containing domain protein, partial [Cladorrhinum sp. PSN259]
VSSPDEYGDSLETAVSYGNLDMSCQLLLVGADVDLFSREYDGIALYKAISIGYSDIIDLLLDYGASFELQDGEGNTPMALAMCYSFEAAEVLLRHSREPEFINTLDADGFTPFFVALKWRSWAVAKVLLESGVRTTVLGWAVILPPEFFSYLTLAYLTQNRIGGRSEAVG